MGAVTTVRLSVYEEETKKFLVGGDVLGAPFVGAVPQKRERERGLIRAPFNLCGTWLLNREGEEMRLTPTLAEIEDFGHSKFLGCGGFFQKAPANRPFFKTVDRRGKTRYNR